MSNISLYFLGFIMGSLTTLFSSHVFVFRKILTEQISIKNDKSKNKISSISYLSVIITNMSIYLILFYINQTISTIFLSFILTFFMFILICYSFLLLFNYNFFDLFANNLQIKITKNFLLNSLKLGFLMRVLTLVSNPTFLLILLILAFKLNEPENAMVLILTFSMGIILTSLTMNQLSNKKFNKVISNIIKRQKYLNMLSGAGLFLASFYILMFR